MTPPDRAEPLDCASCRPLLDAFLLDELSPSAAEGMRLHVTACEYCSVELAGLTRLLDVLAAVPVPTPAADLDEWIVLAAIAERQRRHERRSWLRDLRTQVFRGAVRTTSTLAATVALVALVSATLVFAASNLLREPSLLGGRGATVGPAVTPTLSAPTPAPSAVAPTGTPAPAFVSAAPVPTQVPVTASPAPRATQTPKATPLPTATPAPTGTPEPLVTPVPSATPAPSATESPTVSPSPTDKPRRTPPPTASPTPAPSASATPLP